MTDHTDTKTPGASRKRRLDPAAPLAGVFYLAVAGLFLAGSARGSSIGDPMIVAGIVLVAMGLLGIVQAVLKAQRRDR